MDVDLSCWHKHVCFLRFGNGLVSRTRGSVIRLSAANKHDAGAEFSPFTRLFTLPTCRERQFTSRGGALMCCKPATRKTGQQENIKRRGSPLQSGEPWCEILKLPRPRKPKRDQTCLNASSLICSCVSQYHPVLMSSSRTLWENILPPPPPLTQSNLNNFQLHFNSIYLWCLICVIMSPRLPKNKIIIMECSDCQPLVELSSFFSLPLTGTVLMILFL